jgi:hypothetical protein
VLIIHGLPRSGDVRDCLRDLMWYACMDSENRIAGAISIQLTRQIQQVKDMTQNAENRLMPADLCNRKASLLQHEYGHPVAQKSIPFMVLCDHRSASTRAHWRRAISLREQKAVGWHGQTARTAYSLDTVESFVDEVTTVMGGSGAAPAAPDIEDPGGIPFFLYGFGHIKQCHRRQMSNFLYRKKCSQKF